MDRRHSDRIVWTSLHTQERSQARRVSDLKAVKKIYIRRMRSDDAGAHDL